MHDPDLYSQKQMTGHSPEELLALLQYLADHTRHHIGELQELAQDAPEGAQGELLSACDRFQEGTALLDQVLAKLRGE